MDDSWNFGWIEMVFSFSIPIAICLHQIYIMRKDLAEMKAREEQTKEQAGVKETPTT
jgi:hypothetical protein